MRNPPGGGTQPGKGESRKMIIRLSAAAIAVAAAFPATVMAIDNEQPTVVVTSTRQITRINEQLSDVTVLERADLDEAGQSTIAELLSRQAGLEQAANGGPGASSSVYMRGGANARHTMVLIDGMRVGSASLGQFSWSRLPVSQIERVEILRGPASALYGSDAIGGVIQIFTRRGEGPARANVEAGAGNYGTRSLGAGVSGGTDTFNYSFQATHFRTNGFNSRVGPTYNPDRDGFEDNSASASFAYKVARGHEIGLNLFQSTGSNHYDGSGRTTDYRNDLSVMNYGAYLKSDFSKNWASTVRIGQSTDKSFDLRNGITTSRFRTIQEQYAWQNDISTAYGRFLLGVERLEQQIDSSSIYTQNSRSINSAILGWNVSHEAHRLQTTLRRDDNSQFGGKNTGALAYGYRFSPNWRANASYGTAFKAPSFNDLYYPLDGFGYAGNPNLKPESSKNREASVHYEGDRHGASLTWFSNKITDLISWSGRTSPVNIGNASLSGFTAAYVGRVAGLDLSANATHQTPKDDATGNRLARRAANFGTLAVGQKIGKWEWKTELYGSGGRFDTDANTTRLGGYALLNLYGSYKPSRDWSVFARANNILDKDYATALGYETAGANVFLGVRYTPQ